MPEINMVRMWRMVVNQALIDAVSPTGRNRRSKEEQAEARNWLLKDETDFNAVCHFAQIDPRKLRRYARKLRDRCWAYELREGRFGTPVPFFDFD